MMFKIFVYCLILSNLPDEKFSFLIPYWKDWTILKIHNVHTKKFTLKIRKIFTHFGFLAANGFDKSFKSHILTYWSSEQVKSKFLFDVLTSFTDDKWTFCETHNSFGFLASKMLRFPASVTYAIWETLLTFQQALSITYFELFLCKILSPGNLESRIAIVLSYELLNIIDTSDVFHYTFLTFDLWWSEV